MGGARPSSFTLTTPGKFRLYNTSELIAMPPPEFLIEPVIPEGGLIGLYGQPGTGKSFVAIDMAMAVATGTPWHGHPTRQGFVIYTSAEGGKGIAKRVGAWLHDRRIPASQANIAWLIEAMSTTPDNDDIDTLFERIDEIEEEPKLVIIDTLARCFEGDENKQADMGAFVKGIDKIRHEFGATVIIVHHTRLDGDRERGNTAFRGAADAMISLKRPQHGGAILLNNDKQKDAEEFSQLALSMKVVNPIPDDPRYASCVMVTGAERSDRAPVLIQALYAEQDRVSSEGGIAGRDWASGWTAGQLRELYPEKTERTFFRALQQARDSKLLVKAEQNGLTRYFLQPDTGGDVGDAA